MMTVEKKHPASLLGTEFNNFLFAPIGTDRIGSQVSVVSALARLDMDPWEEAEKLSYLPGETAVQKVMTWMSRFPELAPGFEDRTKTAKRLVALLPKRIIGKARMGRLVTVDKSTLGTIAAVLFITLSLMFAGQIVANLQPAAHRPLARVVSPAATQAPTAPNQGS